MSNDVDVSNKAWNELQADAKAGKISALEAMQRAHDRTEAVYRGYFTPMMEYFRSNDAAREANQQIIIEYLQRQEAAAIQQREDFRAMFEIVSGHTLDIGELKAKVAEYDRELASFRNSRDESIQERRELRADLVISKADRAKIHEELAAARQERQAISDALARIEKEMRRGNGH